MTQEAPRTFQLAINYRSHGGIVQCAHSVVELITEFWPYAIDVLTRERGVVDGSKPVFFSGWDSETVRYVWTCVRSFHETVCSNLNRNNFFSANRESQTSFTQITANIEVLCSGNLIEFGAQQCLLTNRSLNRDHFGD